METLTIERPKCFGKDCVPIIHDLLLAAHWQYNGQSCGCGGRPKNKSYRRNGETIQINLKLNTFRKNKEHEKHLDEVSIVDYI